MFKNNIISNFLQKLGVHRLLTSMWQNAWNCWMSLIVEPSFGKQCLHNSYLPYCVCLWRGTIIKHLNLECVIWIKWCVQRIKLKLGFQLLLADETISLDVGKLIQQARMEKKLTQKDLATVRLTAIICWSNSVDHILV